MIVIAILAIPFIFYFVQRPDYGAIGRDQFARIYDRNVSMLEAQQSARLLNLAQTLGMSDFVGTMTAGAGMDQNQGAVQFIVNLLVLRHEAERLGLRPSASEVAEVVRKLPAFQGDSGFDINKLNDLVQNGLAPLGLAEEHIEQLVRDQICLSEIQKLLAAGVSLPKSELDENFQRGYDKLYVSVIRFRSADLDKDVKINDEDVQKYYDAHKAELRTDEKRKVEFVQLTLNEEEKKLSGKERIEALQKLADRATDFTQALLEKGADFKQAAAKFQLPVHETGRIHCCGARSAVERGSAACRRGFQAIGTGAAQRCRSGGGRILHFAFDRQDRGAAARARRSETENRGRAEEDADTRVNVDQRRGDGATTSGSQKIWSTA